MASRPAHPRLCRSSHCPNDRLSWRARRLYRHVPPCSDCAVCAVTPHSVTPCSTMPRGLSRPTGPLVPRRLLHRHGLFRLAPLCPVPSCPSSPAPLFPPLCPPRVPPSPIPLRLGRLRHHALFRLGQPCAAPPRPSSPVPLFPPPRMPIVLAGTRLLVPPRPVPLRPHQSRCHRHAQSALFHPALPRPRHSSCHTLHPVLSALSNHVTLRN